MITFYDKTDKSCIWICDYEKAKNAYYRYPINISDPEHPTIKINEKDKKRFYVLNELKEIAATLGLDIEGKSRPMITQPNSNMLVFNYTGLKLDFDKNGVPFIKHNGKSIKIWNTAHRVNMAHFTQEKPDEPMVAFYDDTDNNYIWISDYEKETKLRYGYRINRSDREHPKLEPEHPKLEPEPPMGERKLELRQLFCGPNNLKEIATTLGLKIGDPPPVFTSPGRSSRPTAAIPTGLVTWSNTDKGPGLVAHVMVVNATANPANQATVLHLRETS